MAKRRRVGMSSKLQGKLRTAYRAVISAKSIATHKSWQILHRVESELARALGMRSKTTHPKTASRAKGKK